MSEDNKPEEGTFQSPASARARPTATESAPADPAPDVQEKATKVPKEERKVAAQSAPAEGKYAAVRRDMRDPHTNQWYRRGQPAEALKVTKWLKAQLRAGWIKLVVVEEG